MAVKRSTAFVINNKKRDEKSPKFETKLTEDIIKQWKKESKWKDTDTTTTGFKMPVRPPAAKQVTPKRAPYRAPKKPLGKKSQPLQIDALGANQRIVPRHPSLFAIDERRARYKEVLETGTPIRKASAKEFSNYTAALETVHWLVSGGMKIVRVHSAIVRTKELNEHDVDVWIVDKFKRYNRVISLDNPRSVKERTKQLISMFKAGYLIEPSMIDITAQQLSLSLKKIRAFGVNICSVKDCHQSKHGSVIGYILPSGKNGLGEAEMQNAPKAGGL